MAFAPETPGNANLGTASVPRAAPQVSVTHNAAMVAVRRRRPPAVRWLRARGPRRERVRRGSDTAYLLDDDAGGPGRVLTGPDGR
ncbi:hypothetical protein AN216_09935 [Streptomyces oceani]|uniref:Uncharacterized protein n=1 Tax=Streptomyces oceani TaxID=1075402 RepID=A0A1E7KJ68_9ACTN|nr:hypothetical protein AN216_09935 [Streptomyces oceani]